MPAVGIIANPASGRDIRRLVAHGSVFSNNEKVSIVRRILLGLDGVGVERVLFMPDTFRIGWRALDNLHLRLATETIDMPVRDASSDSHVAAERMVEQGVACIITLGGDGTNRAVAKGCGDVPLLALSTGTNNVFPVMMEGTVAGLAAGVLATGVVSAAEATRPTKRVEVQVDGAEADIALIDAAVSRDVFIGARAIWEPGRLRHLVLARAGLHYIGLSSIGGALRPEGLGEGEGLYLELGEGGQAVHAPFAPGLIQRVGIASHRVLGPGDAVELELANCTIALDGEREVEIGRPRMARFTVTENGPRVIEVPRALEVAGKKGQFLAE